MFTNAEVKIWVYSRLVQAYKTAEGGTAQLLLLT